MADFPDFSPPVEQAVPASPAVYVSDAVQFDLHGTANIVLHTFNDGLLYLINQLTLRGSAYTTDVAAVAKIVCWIELNRGLANTGVNYIMLTTQVYLGFLAANQAPTAVSVNMEIPRPLVFLAGSVGTPQLMVVNTSTGNVNASFVGAAQLLCWPLN